MIECLLTCFISHGPPLIVVLVHGEFLRKGTDNTSASPSGTDRVTLGRLGDSSPSWHFSGSLAEVGIWDVALTDAEIAALAAGLPPNRLVARRGNLVAYYPLYNPDGVDYSGNGNHLTTVGGSPVRADHIGMLPENPPVRPQNIRGQTVRRR